MALFEFLLTMNHKRMGNSALNEGCITHIRALLQRQELIRDEAFDGKYSLIGRTSQNCIQKTSAWARTTRNQRCLPTQPLVAMAEEEQPAHGEPILKGWKQLTAINSQNWGIQASEREALLEKKARRRYTAPGLKSHESKA